LTSGSKVQEIAAIGLLALKEIYDDPGARFRSEEQAKAVHIALEGAEDLLAILERANLWYFSCQHGLKRIKQQL